MTAAIDTHAHLDFDAYDGDREDVIARARESGVVGIVNVAIDARSSEVSVQLAEQYPDVWATVGVHPHDSETASEGDFVRLRELGEHPKVVAVGEVGLDYYRDYAPRETQKRIFRRMLELARELELPVIIHMRAAEEDTLAILEEEMKAGPLRGVFHCFSGDKDVARRVLDLGFHISFCGNLTFRKSRLPEIVREVPIDRLLLETDSPFLTPEPFRGRRNEPAYVHYIARKIAEVKGLSYGEVLARTTQNARALFGMADDR